MRKTFIFMVLSFFVVFYQPALFAQQEDLTPPVLQSLDFTPKTVDVSGGSQSITITARVTDALSGVNSGYFYFVSPTRTQSRGNSYYAYYRIEGDANDGIYRFTIDFPQYSEAGEWQVGYFYAYDNVGNSRFYYPDELAAVGYPTTLTVIGGPDLAPPALQSLSYTPSVIDVSGGSQSITVTARVTDALSGVNSGYFYFVSPTRTQSRGNSYYAYYRIEGDANDGIYRFTIDFPQYSEAGEWQVGYFYAYDNVGNSRFYYPDELADVGYPTTLSVVSNPSDNTPPALQSLSYTPSVIDLSGGSQSITVTARVTDALSGVNSGYFYFVSPTRTQSRGNSYYAYYRIEGDANDGIYRFTIDFPQYSEAGEWQVGYFYAYDNVGNSRFYYPDELAAVGYPTTLSVSENQAPVAEAGADKTALIAEQISLNGGSSLDPDGYISAWAWDFGDGSPAGSGASVSHAYAQPGQFTVTLTVTDDDGATAVDQAIVIVKTPAGAAENLIADVKSGVSGVVQTSLVSKLNNALEALEKKSDTVAVNKLMAFINEVEAQKGKKIPTGVADQWIALANRIIASVQAGANAAPAPMAPAAANVKAKDPLESRESVAPAGPPSPIRLRVDEPGVLTVAITDSKGKLVGMVSGRPDKAGYQILVWDGTDLRGNPCPRGIYRFQAIGTLKPGQQGVIIIR